MRYLEQVQRGIDYVEQHLDHDISLNQIARAAGISQWHFQRIFKALTNETLKTYIRARRFANSLEKLMASDERIIDIALQAGFESQESFTRAFKQAFNMTPNEYRKLGKNKLFLKKIRIDADYLAHINQNVSLQPEIYRQGVMTLVGLRTRFYSVDSDKNNIASKLPPLWAQFVQRLQEIPHRVPGMCYGLVQQTAADSDLLEYYAAVAVERVSDLPEGMASIELPATQYARFTHRGLPAQLDTTVNYVYSSWLLQSSYRHSGGPDLEFYGDDYVPESDRSVMYYAIPVK